MKTITLHPETDGHLDAKYACTRAEFENEMAYRFGNVAACRVREERNIVWCYYTEEAVESPSGAGSYPLHLGSWHDGEGWVFKHALSQQIA